jgi:hypothetical protein
LREHRAVVIKIIAAKKLSSILKMPLSFLIKATKVMQNDMRRKKVVSKTLHDWYENSCISLARYELEKQGQEPHELDEQIDEMVKGWQEVIDMIDQNYPEIRSWYMRKQAMQKSFTPEQIDHICYQIGEWYLGVKELLEGQHNLGYMKEKLKTMICGDG